MSAEDKFRDWAESEGWKVTKRGWPDFICRRNGAVMTVEVKAGLDSIRPEQYEAMRDLASFGMATFLWTVDTGLRVFPEATKTHAEGALLYEIDQLHESLRSVIAERDRLAAALADHRPVKLRAVEERKEWVAPSALQVAAKERDHWDAVALREAQLESLMTSESFERRRGRREQPLDPAQVLLRTRGNQNRKRRHGER